MVVTVKKKFSVAEDGSTSSVDTENTVGLIAVLDATGEILSSDLILKRNKNKFYDI